jgi:predicted small secreted protein
MNFKKTSILAVCILLLASLSSACGASTVRGSGKMIEDARQVSNFDKLSLSGIGDLILIQGDQESLRIEGEDNILAQIDTQVKDGTLVISPKDANWEETLQPTKRVVYHLNMKTVHQLELTGVGSINIGQLKTDQLEILSSGVEGVDIGNLSAKTLEVALRGEGQCNLAGEIDSQQVELSGTGQYNAAKLQSQKTAIDLSGAGSASVWVEQSLTANLSGTGSLYYYGNPQIDKTVTGVGGINDLGATAP